MRDVVACPDCQFNPGLQIEKRHRAVLEFPADDTFGRQAQPVAVERQRSFKVVDAQRDDGYAWFHFDLNPG